MILLADDSVHALRMGEQILRGEGYEVVTATGGGAAAAMLLNRAPEMLIVDAFLPERTGLELCRQAKAAYAAAKVILTAGALEEIDEAGALAAGRSQQQIAPRSVLRVPSRASAMLDAVKRLATNSSGDAALQAAVAKALEAELPRMVREIAEKVRDQMKKAK